MLRLFQVFGAMILGLFSYADYRGWSPSSYNELKNVPKSIRDNPGAYRSMYQRYYHK
jgi:hypothetical protein